MSTPTPTIVLVHGAFAESGSWNPVIQRLQADGYRTVAAANPLRSVTGDAAYVRDVIARVGAPVVLVGHSYGGCVITEAAAGNEAVVGLVYVAAFAPDTGESALQLSSTFPGSTLGDALDADPLTDGGVDFTIQQALFHRQFAADVPAGDAALMAATQRPVTQAALAETLATDVPAWKTLPSWFVFGDLDFNIPIRLHRFLAERARSQSTLEIAGASHAISVSASEAVAATVRDAVAGTSAAVGANRTPAPIVS